MRSVAEQLGNTPAVARRSYVDPRVCAAYQEGRTIDVSLREAADGNETRAEVERAVLRLLSRS
jgi:DNA topoisomerase IB